MSTLDNICHFPSQEMSSHHAKKSMYLSTAYPQSHDIHHFSFHPITYDQFTCASSTVLSLHISSIREQSKSKYELLSFTGGYGPFLVLAGAPILYHSSHFPKKFQNS